MKAKISKSVGNSAIVVYVDGDGYAQACVVDLRVLPTQRVDHEFQLTEYMLEQATPYGIDLEVVYPNGISIDLRLLQHRLYNAGVVSLDDLKKHPSAIGQELLAMIPAMSAEIYKQIKIAMEDYNV